MLKKVLFKKDSGSKEVIVEIGLIVVAVFLIVLFRSNIYEIMGKVFQTASTSITDLFKNPSSSTSTTTTAP